MIGWATFKFGPLVGFGGWLCCGLGSFLVLKFGFLIVSHSSLSTFLLFPLF